MRPSSSDGRPGLDHRPGGHQADHDYWTKPGRRATPRSTGECGGDFNRCRALVGEKIAENSPEDLRFLNQICAQWHHDALGYLARSSTCRSRHHAAETWRRSVGPGGRAGRLRRPQGPRRLVRRPAADRTHPPDRHRGGPGVRPHRGVVHLPHRLRRTSASPRRTQPPATPTSPPAGAPRRRLARPGPGCISLGGGHAGGRLRPRGAIEHYDSTSTAVADVAVGEDDHGIWCAGWVRPGTSDDVVTRCGPATSPGTGARSAASMEMIAALGGQRRRFPRRCCA